MQHTELQIFQATTPAQIEQARSLFEEYAAQLKVDLCFQGFAQELASLPGLYAPPAGRLLLATLGDSLIGCGALRPLAPDVCEMKRLYVRSSARGLKVGRRLAVAIIEAAREIGYSK